MYGQERTHFPWSTPPRPRTTPIPDDTDSPSSKRYSTGMYFGFDGSDSGSTSGGFTPVSRGAGGHSRSGSGGHATPMTTASMNPAQVTNRQKVNQIVQAFFWKAAMVIIQSRMVTVPLLSSTTQERKTNKWFNIELDEQESFREEVKLWRTCDAFEPKPPPPLIIETYLDTSDLTPTQALVILDGEGKRWNVTETMENAANRFGLNAGPRKGERGNGTKQQIVLERWRIELSPPFDVSHGLELPVVYKKGIILFRALYSYAALMPTWKFRRRLTKLKLHTNALKIGCRIVKGDDLACSTRSWDGLKVPLYHGEPNVTDTFQFVKVESPAGFFNISVAYRKNCDFKVDDSEALLSSHFINLDEHYYRPSRGHQRTVSQPTANVPEAGSLPSAAVNPQRPDYNPAYGSLSSFHQVPGATGASPITALRTAGEMAEKQYSSGSPADRPPIPMSVRSLQGSKSSLRSVEGNAISRRGSLSFMQPFKSPSLSASPASSEVPAGSSLGRYSTTPSIGHRQRPSLGTVSPSPAKLGISAPPASDSGSAGQNPVPISASPKPQSMTRIASSFSTRKPRVSSAASRTEDDNNSSGRASYSSSTAAPGSGLFAEPGAGSFEEDLQIRDFMSMIADGQKQTLKSFQPGGAAEGSSKRAANALSRFSKMRDSQSVLADSLSSSLLLQPSTSPSTSSRQLSNVPGMVSSLAFSSSSSPGKPMSPHTPHTPAIPSRLSEGLTAQYDQQQRDMHRHYRPRSRQETEHELSPDQGRQGRATTSPLDIPLSPRLFGHRRSNSMTHRETVETDNLDFDPLSGFGTNQRQSASLGSVDMVPLSLSQLASIRHASQTALPGREQAESDARSADHEEEEEGLAFGPPRPPSMDSAEGEAPRYQHRFQRQPSLQSSGSSYRGRFSARGRGNTPPMGSTASLERERGAGGDRPGTMDRRTSSWSRAGPMGEDEDLLFAMSDMSGQQSRKSLEQDRGSGGDTSNPSRRRSRGAGVDSGSMRHWGL